VSHSHVSLNDLFRLTRRLFVVLCSSATVRLCTNEEFKLTRDMVFISKKTETQHMAKYTPNVIEPAFGIGRIFYSILEHTFYVRPTAGAAAGAAASKPAAESKQKEKDVDKERRTVFALPAHLAPTKLTILPLSASADLDATIKDLSRTCILHNLSYKVDASAGSSIGKRYSRADEIGIPYGITIDFETKNDGCVTVRERDSMQQIRVKIADAIPIVDKLTQGHTSWDEMYNSHPKFTTQQE
jgi:glycyl-tRNA synthetase